jgi:hypothetical protein
MGLDIRLPIGLLFALLGALLAVFGLVSDPAIYKRSLDLNVNLWWGLAMLVFGALMMLGGWRRPAGRSTEPPDRAGSAP